MIGNINNCKCNFKSLLLSGDEDTKENLIKKIGNYSLQNMDIFAKECRLTHEISNATNVDVIIKSTKPDDEAAQEYFWSARITSQKGNKQASIIAGFTNPVYCQPHNINEITKNNIAQFFSSINAKITQLARGEEDVDKIQGIAIRMQALFAKFGQK